MMMMMMLTVVVVVVKSSVNDRDSECYDMSNQGTKKIFQWWVWTIGCSKGHKWHFGHIL